MNTIRTPIASAIEQAKGRWLDRFFKRIMPPFIYELRDAVSKRKLKQKRKWFVNQGIHVNELPDETRLMRCNEVLSTFKVARGENGKLQVTTTNEPETTP